MIWCTVCSLKSGKIESTDVLGPYEDIEQMKRKVRRLKRDIKSEGYKPVVVPFELCSDDVPEALHELTK